MAFVFRKFFLKSFPKRRLIKLQILRLGTPMASDSFSFERDLTVRSVTQKSTLSLDFFQNGIKSKLHSPTRIKKQPKPPFIKRKLVVFLFS